MFIKNIEVYAAIIIKDKKIFITQRDYGEFKNLWEFPDGKIEPNESLEACIKRTIKEELDKVQFLPADILILDSLKKFLSKI